MSNRKPASARSGRNHGGRRRPAPREINLDDVEWISDSARLKEWCEEARKTGLVAVDTEFHRERTFFADLALVQLAAGGKIACVDPIVDGIDLSPLDALVTDPQVMKIMHAGRQDLEIFFDRTGQVVAPLFDTQVAASFLGMGEQLSYGAIVERVCKISLSKAQVRTDWMHRPLAPEVLDYAANDVRYLEEIYTSMREALDTRGRMEWLQEELDLMHDLSSFQYDPKQAWLRVKGTDKLRGVSCAIAQKLAAWREEEAREVNRPRKRVIPDEIITDLAKMKPRRMEQLQRMRGLDQSARKRYGELLLRMVADMEQSPKEEWPEPRKRGPIAQYDDAVAEAMNAVLEIRAREEEISPGMISTRKEVQHLAAGETGLRILKGWRYNIAGQDLEAFLQGKHAIKVVNGELNIFPVPGSSGSEEA